MNSDNGIEVYPGWLDLGLSTLVLVVAACAFKVLVMNSAKGTFGSSLNVDNIFFDASVVLILYCILVFVSWYFCCVKYRMPIEIGLGLKSAKNQAYFEAIVGGIIFEFVIVICDNHFGFSASNKNFQELLGHHNQIKVLLLASITIGPFIEEIYFRGFLLRVFRRKLGDFMGAIIVIALFAGAHFDRFADWFGVLAIVLGSTFLTLLAIRWKSIQPSIAMHLSMNLVSFLSFKHLW